MTYGLSSVSWCVVAAVIVLRELAGRHTRRRVTRRHVSVHRVLPLRRRNLRTTARPQLSHLPVQHNHTTSVFPVVICSQNRVPGAGSKILYPVPKGITTQFSTAIVQNTTSFGLHLFTTLSSIVALHIHKLRRSITRMSLVSETTNIISCDAPTPQAVVFITNFRYLDQIEFETGSGFLDNFNRVPSS